MQEPPHLTSITTAPGETTSFAYTPEGLMRSMTDARSNTTQFSWNVLGLLSTDRDAEGGQQTLTRTETTDSHAVESTTLAGRTKRYVRTTLPNADVGRTATSPAGLPTSTTFGADGNTVVSFSDGMRLETREASDPAWGMQSAFTEEAKMVWPAERTLSTTMSREATFVNPEILSPLRRAPIA